MKMIVTLDGSPLAESILEKASSVAALPDVDVTLVYVVEVDRTHAVLRNTAGLSPEDIRGHVSPASGTAVGAIMPPQMPPLESEAQAAEAVVTSAEDYLSRIDREHFEGKARRRVVATHEHAGEAILDAAREEHADLVAMATHGRTGLARVLMGSVADKVLRSGAVPVMMWRPKGLAGE